ncbi:hypothetical protein [Nocardioides humi]|uniref:Uncharacterized protein n=1 Tax=Nocardioides humi TaxID=449461 RepID=A0ABN2AMB7_9ACTN|nr:hypothetical protein [Nocardioides humi]
MTITESAATSGVAARAKTATWLFLGSFVACVGVIVVSMLLFNRDYQTALYDRADELGVNQNHLPAEVMADLGRAHPDALGVLVATAALFLLSGALLAWGTGLLGGVAGRRASTQAAIVLALLGGLAMAVMTFLPRRLSGGSAWLADNWWVYLTLVNTAVIADALALILVAIGVRSAGLARRTAVVVIALCALTVVAQLVASAPPIVPMLLGTVLAFNVERAARRTGPGTS